MEPIFKLTKAEARLAEQLWDNAPIASMELVKLAQREFCWKKSTTFTNLKFLIEKGLAKNENSCVTMLYTRDEFLAGQSRRYVDDTFGGSLPLFVASFTSGRKLTSAQVDELKRLIEEHEGGDDNGYLTMKQERNEYRIDAFILNAASLFDLPAEEPADLGTIDDEDGILIEDAAAFTSASTDLDNPAPHDEIKPRTHPITGEILKP